MKGRINELEGQEDMEAAYQGSAWIRRHTLIFFSTQGRILWFLMSSAKINPDGPF